MTGHRIAVLIPSRGRPRSLRRLLAAIDDTAAHPEQCTVWARIDDDDPHAGAYQAITHSGPTRLHVTTGPRTRLAASWNELAAAAADTGATHLAMWGDDNIPVTPGWDTRFVNAFTARGPGMAYGKDNVWDRTYNRDIPGHLVLPTATIWPTAVYQALGWVSPPGLVHLCIDVAWRDLGLAAGALHYLPDVTIRHLHRCTGAPDDQTYRDANDNPNQVAADNVALTVWRNSPAFTTARQALENLRAR